MRLSTVVLLSIASAFATGLSVQPGHTAPRFSLVRLDSAQRRVNLRDFADSARHASHPEFGRPVVLSFWSTTCVNCKAEFPRLQKWATAHPNVLFLPVLVEDDDPAEGVHWLRSAGVKENGLLDRYQVAGKSYGVCEGEICTVPALVAIGPDQQVKLARLGYHPELPLEADLDRALSLKTSP
jgi:thiol-disulfide isomerase/thioredoxin